MTLFGARIISLSELLPALPLLAAGTAAALRYPPAGFEKPLREIHVEAHQFEFKPAEIEVGEGEKVRITIVSEDVVHGFNIIGTKINVLVPPKGAGEAEVVFQPEKSGEYRFKCSKVCGSGHLLMRGVIVVR